MLLSFVAADLSLHTITKYAQLVAICLVIVMVIGGVWMYWYLKVRKRKKVTHQDINYDSLEHKDSLDFCKFDDIKDDMIITDNGSRFIGIIKTRGYDYFQASADERNRTEGGYGSFINTIDKFITFRQYTKAVDLDNLRESYKSAYDNVEEVLYNLNEDFNSLVAQYYELQQDGKLEDDIELQILNKCEEMGTQIEVYDYRRMHLADNLNYIDQVTKVTSPEKVQTYVFDWTYDPLMGVADYTDEEIMKKAVTELKQKEDAYIHALANAGVRASRVRTDELIQMYRRHFHPLTANIFTQKCFENSNYFSEITTSSGLKESDYEIAEESGILPDIQDAQEKVYDDMIKRGVDPDTATTITQSYTIEDLGKSVVEEQEAISLNTDDIEDRKKAILTNKFEEKEKKRLKEEQDRHERERRTGRAEHPFNAENDHEDHIYTGLDFDLDIPGFGNGKR